MTGRPNEGYCYRERVGGSAAGQPVLAYLSSRYRHSSETTWGHRIEAGRVRVDGKPVDALHRLQSNETLSWHRPPWVEPAAPLSFAVLYSDEDVLAVAKPRGLPAMPGGGYYEHTLLRRVEAFAPGASPMHRLGRGTSGITLFARNSAARKRMTRAWRDRAVIRRYRALAIGHLPKREISIDAPVGPVPHAVLGTVAGLSAHGKPSLTHVRVLETRDHDGGETSLLEIQIETGRPHQIRIHLASIGHPLKGDALYPPGGVPGAGTSTLPGEMGYLLHAHYLRFPHQTGEPPVTIECVPPPSLRESFS